MFYFLNGDISTQKISFSSLREVCLERFYDRSIAHSVVHGGAEQDAVSPEVSASGAEERAILVQEPQGQEQTAEDGSVRGRIAATTSISRRLVNFLKIIRGTEARA